MTSLGLGLGLAHTRRRLQVSNAPVWVPSGATAFWDYQNNRGYSAGADQNSATADRSLTRTGATSYDRAYSTSFVAGAWRRTSAGLLIEEQSTNRAYHSVPGGTNWSLYQMLKNQNSVVVPDGTTTGTTATVNNAAGGSIYIDGVAAANGMPGNVVRTQSLLVKAGTRDAGNLAYSTQSNGSGCMVNFNLTTPSVSGGSSIGTGSYIGATIRDLGNGWYRITITGTLTNSASNALPFCALGMAAGTSGQTLLTWAMQVNDGGYPLSYIPTTTAAATRNLDAITEGANALSPMQAAAGTRIITVTDLPTAAVACPILGANDTFAILQRKADGSVETAWGGAQATATQALANWAGSRKVGISWNAGRVVVGAQGVSSVGANNAPAAITSLKLGSLSTAALNGLILTDTIYPTFNDTAALDALLA